MSDFKAPLPLPPTVAWEDALTAVGKPGLGSASYEAPGSSPRYFVLDDIRFSGGQSVDRAEYPFDGGWSNRRLNEKPQEFSVSGHLLDDRVNNMSFHWRRKLLIDELRVPTDDDRPGHLTLPFWGRIPVVVVEQTVEERTASQGRSNISIQFYRAGLSESDRETLALSPRKVANGPAAIKASGASPGTNAASGAASLVSTVPSAGSVAAAPTSLSFDDALQLAQDGAVDSFCSLSSDSLSLSALDEGLRQVTSTLLNVLSRVRAGKTLVTTMTNKIVAVVSLLDQGIHAPATLAQGLLGGFVGIATGLVGLIGDVEDLFSPTTTDEGSAAASARAVALAMLSMTDYRVATPIATVRDQVTTTAIESLQRTGAYLAAAILLPQVAATKTQARDLMKLFLNLEVSIDRESPVTYQRLQQLRLAVNLRLQRSGLAIEQLSTVAKPLPLITLARVLGTSTDVLIALNPHIEDQFLVSGVVRFV